VIVQINSQPNEIHIFDVYLFHLNNAYLPLAIRGFTAVKSFPESGMPLISVTDQCSAALAEYFTIFVVESSLIVRGLMITSRLSEKRVQIVQ
jgi:hypothetical protein